MRELKRPITRRIGQVVVTLTADGILVRRFRRREAATSKVIGYATLLSQRGADPCKSRADAFSGYAPEGWQPKPGDSVWISYGKAGRASRGVVLSVISSVPNTLYSVAFKGWEKRGCLFEIGDLRPAPAKADKVTRPLLEKAQ